MEPDDEEQHPEPDDEEQHPEPGDGRVDSDDTTQADAGMTGGTGTVPGQATENPGGTRPHIEDSSSED